MDWGMERRMAQIIPPQTGKAFFLAVDHGYFLGPTRMLENPGRTVADLTPIADAGSSSPAASCATRSRRRRSRT